MQLETTTEDANVTQRIDPQKLPKSVQRLFESAPPLDKEKELARRFLRLWTRPEGPGFAEGCRMPAAGRVTGYTLKHMAEESIGGYVCESSLIAAAIEEGYQVKSSRMHHEGGDVVVWPPLKHLQALRSLPGFKAQWKVNLDS